MNYKEGAPPPGFVPPPAYTPSPAYQGHPPQMQTAPTVVVIRQAALGPETQRMTCPNCHADISTRVETEPTAKTHLFALLLCLIGMWPCAPCPYCIDSCLVKKHYCPNCKAYLGEYEN